ncbi:MAG: hypothetical protein K2X82_02985, partial [Gemmataceae bacterium]|nr:hypothetical protein [Gemmataceae bacterium]
RLAAVGPGGRRAVVTSWHGKGARLWDLAAPPAGAPLPGPVADPDQVGFLPDGETAFTVERGRGVGWWRLAGGEAARPRPEWLMPAARCLAPHPDGGRVLIGQRDGSRTGFWDLATGNPTGPDLPHPGAVNAVAVDPGGKWAATAGEDGLVRVWSLPDGKPVDRVIFHADRVNQMAFGSGPAAGVLATASDDRTVRFWDVRTGLPLGPPLRHPEAVPAVAFAPDGLQVMTGGRDGVARFWPVPTPDG